MNFTFSIKQKVVFFSGLKSGFLFTFVGISFGNIFGLNPLIFVFFLLFSCFDYDLQFVDKDNVIKE